MRRAVRNIGYLMSGSAVAAGLQFITLILTARALGPTTLGLLAMIEAHVRLVDGLVRLEPWQAVIKYGAHDLEHDQPQRFRALIKFGVLVDIGGATLAALAAISLAPLVGFLSGWSAETIQLACLYSLVMLTRLSATWTGVLRLFDRFKLIAAQQAIIAAVRLALVAVAFFMGAGLGTFLAIAAIAAFCGHGIAFVAGWRVLRARGYGGFFSTPLAGMTRDHPNIWSFMWAINGSALIRRTTREADILIVGGVLGPAAAGLYHVAKKLGEAIIVLAVPIQQAMFPDIARLWARGAVERFRRTVTRVNWLTGLALTLLIPLAALNIERIIAMTVGAEFADGAHLVIMQLTAAVVMLYGITNRAALQSMGKHTQLLWVVIAATLVFFAILLPAIQLLGVLGASVTHLAANLVWLAGTVTVLRRGLQEAEVGGGREDDGRPAAGAPCSDPGRPGTGVQ